MVKLNRQFKGKDRDTDVLAFNLAENGAADYIEGEIYVNLQIAARQAAEFDVDYYEEIIRLCIHGFLHLLGYDDMKIRVKNKMWQVQENYISRFLAKDY
jgi:rRNA maturation RNase YbeY